jgi:hypothetical protein
MAWALGPLGYMYYEIEAYAEDRVRVTGWSVTLYATVRRFWNPAPLALARARWRVEMWLLSDGTQSFKESCFRWDLSEWLVLPPLIVFIGAEVGAIIGLLKEVGWMG